MTCNSPDLSGNDYHKVNSQMLKLSTFHSSARQFNTDSFQQFSHQWFAPQPSSNSSRTLGEEMACRQCPLYIYTF